MTIKDFIQKMFLLVEFNIVCDVITETDMFFVLIGAKLFFFFFFFFGGGGG